MDVTIKDNSQMAKDELDNKVQIALEQCGLTAERFSKEICPVRTGRLRNSISHAPDGNDEFIGTNVEYAPYVENGVSGRTPRYFLRNAIKNNVQVYLNIIKKVMKS